MYSNSGNEVSLSQRRAIEALLPALGHAFAAVSHNRAISIDCRIESLRLAALTILDSLLSHGRDAANRESDAALVLASVAPLGHDHGGQRRVQSQPNVSTLINSLSRPGAERVFLLLSASHLLIYAKGESARTLLSTDLDSAKFQTALQFAAFESSWIDSPQSLQEKMRRIFDDEYRAHPNASEQQVH